MTFIRFVFICAIAIIVCQYSLLERLYTGLTFFSESYIVDNFRSVTKIGQPYSTAYPTKNIAEFVENKSNDLGLPRGLLCLPETFTFKDQTYNLKDWLRSHWTTGLVVLKVDSLTKANLVHESYYLGNTNETKTISWSVGKSVVSALIGIAVKDGKINSIDDDVTKYVLKLKGSAYDGVKIKDVLQMSSGVKFNEDYDDVFSDINTMAYWIAMKRDLIHFATTLRRFKEPGTFHNYISIDTQILGYILKNATGMSLTQYLEDKLWKMGGFESTCDWLLDNEKSKMELAFGTLVVRTRDYARFGWLYLNKGLSPLDGSRIIDEQWINDSVSIKESDNHLKPNYPDKFGYGYQWWIPGSDEHPTESNEDYMAIGVYNQFIYIDPKSHIVIARNSANPNYNKEYDPDTDSNVGETQTVAAFRAIAKHYC